MRRRFHSFFLNKRISRNISRSAVIHQFQYTVPLRSIEIAGIPAIFPGISAGIPEIGRNSAGIIEIYIFQNILPFPVFLVYNFKLLSTFFQLSLSGEYQTSIFETTLKS
jgi:hypothetical protein